MIATSLLPSVFALCGMVADAWISFDDGSDVCSSKASIEIGGDDGHWATCACGDSFPEFRVGRCLASSSLAGTVELEVWIIQALTRALRAIGALALRSLQPTEEDAVAAAIAIVSMCSVAFIAWPTYIALAEAECTYQVSERLGIAARYNYSSTSTCTIRAVVRVFL